MYNALDSERQKKLNVLYIGALGIAVIYVNTLIRISRKERNVLFNDALNIFYLRLYGVRHMVMDPLSPHGLLFPSSSKGSFICTIPQTG